MWPIAEPATRVKTREARQEECNVAEVVRAPVEVFERPQQAGVGRIDEESIVLAAVREKREEDGVIAEQSGVDSIEECVGRGLGYSPSGNV